MSKEELEKLTVEEIDKLIEDLQAEKERRLTEEHDSQMKVIEGYLSRHPKQSYCTYVEWWDTYNAYPEDYTGEKVLLKYDKSGLINKVSRLDKEDKDYEKVLEIIQGKSKIKENVEGDKSEGEEYGNAYILKWDQEKGEVVETDEEIY